MILCGILAFSSRQQSFWTGSDEVEASVHHSRCLELVIAAISQPEQTYDDNLLAAVVILRLYEEFNNDEDTRCHLLGTSQLLNHIASFSSSGGLAEAASWLSLRQAIYSTLVQKQPFRINLANYEKSSAFHPNNDGEYANVMVFLLAKILDLIGVHDGRAVDSAVVDGLEDEVERWNSMKPTSFCPIYFEDTDVEAGSSFPDIQLLAAPQGMGSYTRLLFASALQR